MSLAVGVLITLFSVVASQAIIPDIDATSLLLTENGVSHANSVATLVVVLQNTTAAKTDKSGKPDSAEDSKTAPKFLDYPGTVLSFVGSSLLLLLLVAFLWAAFWEVRRKTIVIDPVDIAKDLADKGYTSYVIAQRIASELAALQRTARLNSRFEEDFELSATQIDFTVPSAGISYRAMIRYLRQLSGRFEQRVQGEIVCDSGAIRIQLRTSDGSRTPDNLVVTSEQEIPNLLQKTALEVGLLIAPYLVLNYWFRVEQGERTFQKTFEVVRWCLANAPADQHHRAYIVWGSALAIQRNFEEAEEKLRLALSLKPNFASTYNCLGNLNRARRRFDQAAKMYWKAILCDRRDSYPPGNLGNVCNDRHKYHKAIRYYHRALRLNPRYETALSGIGYAQWKLGRYPEAERTFSRAIDVDPNYGWSYLNWARLLRSQHDYDEGIAKARIAAEQTATRAEAYATWGDILVEAERFEEAKEVYRRALNADPGLGNGQAGLAFCLFRQQRYNDAIAAAEEAVSINPYHTPARGVLAESLRLSHRFDEAIDRFKELLHIDPYQSGAHVGWGQILRSRHKLHFALARFESATKIDSRDSWAWRSLGDTYIQMHRYKRALRSFRKAVEVDPRNSWGYMGYGDVLLRLGRLDEALVQYRKACELDSRNRWARRRLIDTLIDLGWTDNAVAEIDLRKGEGQELTSLVGVGYLYLRLGRSQAADKYEKAADIQPHADILIDWGHSLVNTQNYKRALDVFRRALAIDSWNESARSGLCQTLERMGRLPVALRLYSRAHRRAPESVRLLLDWSALLRHKAQRLKGKDEKMREALYAEAEAKVLKAINIDPWNTAPLRAHGDLLLDLELPEEAITDLDNALRLDRCDWLAWAGRGAALRACKRPAHALKSYQRALRFRPNSEWLLTDLAKCLRDLGRHEEANVELGRVLEINPRNAHAKELRDESLRKLGRFA